MSDTIKDIGPSQRVVVPGTNTIGGVTRDNQTGLVVGIDEATFRRLTKERDELREALCAAAEYLGYHSPDSQFEPTGFGGKTIGVVVADALANAAKGTEI